MSERPPYEKAIEETAKTAGKVIEAGSDLGKFASRIFGATIQELAGWSYDVVSTKRLHWQAKNISQVMEDIRALGENGAPMRAIPARQAALVLDAIANEDDPELQLVWAYLLKAATDESGNYEIKRVHIDVLRSIDPPEALIIKAIGVFLENRDAAVSVLTSEELKARTKLSEPSLTIYLHHLSSLGCFIASDKSVGFAPEPAPLNMPIKVVADDCDFQITDTLFSLLAVLQNWTPDS